MTRHNTTIYGAHYNSLVGNIYNVYNVCSIESHSSWCNDPTSNNMNDNLLCMNTMYHENVQIGTYNVESSHDQSYAFFAIL
jgi:hypothetical protein